MRVGGVVAFFMADDDYALAAKPSHPADQGLIVGKLAVATKLDEILDQPGDIIDHMRTLWVTGDLRLLPGIEVGIGLGAPFGDAPP